MAGWIASKTWHRASLLFVSRSAFGPLPTLFTPDTPVMRVTLVTRLHCYRLHRFSVSAYQRIIVSAYQCINVPAYQRINVPAYRRSSVPAYRRTSASVYYAAGLQLIKHSAEQRISVEPRPTRIATTLLFSRVCSCSGFCGKWESLAAKRKKKAGKVPQTENQKNR